MQRQTSICAFATMSFCFTQSTVHDKNVRETKSQSESHRVPGTTKATGCAVREFLRDKYQIELANIVIEQPPKVEMGEFALPFSFELAKKLRKASAQDCRRDRRRDSAARGLREARGRGRGIHQCRLKRDDRQALARDGHSRSREPRGRRRRRRQRQNSGRAHQHQSQQGRAHRASAQRHSRRYLCSPAARGRSHSRRPELHRQHRRAGGRRGGRVHAPGEKVEAGNRGVDRVEPALRLLLLGPLCASLAMVRAGQGEPEVRAARRCMPSSRAATRWPRSPISSRRRCCGAIWRPWTGSTSSTTSCRARARSCTCTSGSRRSSC